jgi:hypothetical protein
MGKSTLLIITLILSVTLSYAVSFEGSGTKEDPYRISSLNDLRELSDSSSVWDKYFIQTADINAAGTKYWNTGDHDGDSNTADEAMGFSPIGEWCYSPTWGIAFSGSYNGNGYKIDSLYINRPATSIIGLFGYVEGYGDDGDSSKFENLSVVNANYTGTGSIGVIIGYNTSRSVVSNCRCSGEIKGGNMMGGLVGYNSQSIIENSYSEVTVNGNGYKIGGLVGSNYNGSVIKNSYSLGSVTGAGEKVGGLAGECISSTITDCYSAADVNGASEKAGGLVGYCDKALINTSYSTGNVQSNGGQAGGLIGRIDNWTYVKNCYSRGNVSSTDHAGGLIGYLYESRILNCYSTGSVNANSDVGGLLGYNGGSGYAENNFWDTQASGQSSSAMATGKTSAEMKDVATFTSLSSTGLSSAWDFVSDPNDDSGSEDYWDMDQLAEVNDGYPILTWQDGADSTLTAIETSRSGARPEGYFLGLNYPNPFNPSTTIGYQLEKSGPVSLVVYNISGQKVLTLVNKRQDAGAYSVKFDAGHLSSGVYFYRLKTADFTLTRKMVLAK